MEILPFKLTGDSELLVFAIAVHQAINVLARQAQGAQRVVLDALRPWRRVGWSTRGGRPDDQPAADLLSCLAMASEEDAVVFSAELREVGVCRRWIGFEVEAMSGFRWRRDGDSNGRQTLKKVTAEFVRGVTEANMTFCHAAPLDFH